MTTDRRRALLRADFLPRAIPVALGVLLMLAALEKAGRLWAGRYDDVPFNEIAFPVELTWAFALLLGGHGRRLAALFLAVMMPVAIMLEVFLHFAADAGDWWWFLPLPLPFAAHVVVLAVIGAGAVAILVHGWRDANRERPEAYDLRGLIRLFE